MKPVSKWTLEEVREYCATHHYCHECPMDGCICDWSQYTNNPMGFVVAPPSNWSFDMSKAKQKRLAENKRDERDSEVHT